MVAGDSLTRYTFLSLRWARRRAVLHSKFCSTGTAHSDQIMQTLGDGSGGLSRWFWSVMQGSQGLEGDYIVPVSVITNARAWLGWEQTSCHGYCETRRFGRVLGMTYTPWIHMHCAEQGAGVSIYTENNARDLADAFRSFFEPNATSPTRGVALLNIGGWQVTHSPNQVQMRTDYPCYWTHPDRDSFRCDNRFNIKTASESQPIASDAQVRKRLFAPF